MAHDGHGTGWDVAAPADADPRKDGAKEIRDLRKGVGIRVDKEHVTLAAGSAGGEHKEGSAKVYYDVTETFPTNRPDGSTPLSAADAGRLAFLGGVLYDYNGTNWGTTRKGTIVPGAAPTYSAWVDVDRPFKTIAFHDSGATTGVNFVVVTGSLSDVTLRVAAISHDGSVETFDVDVEQATDPTYRFRIRSDSGFGGTLRYHVLQ